MNGHTHITHISSVAKRHWTIYGELNGRCTFRPERRGTVNRQGVKLSVALP
jgi:hypothetical protein